MTRIEMIQQGWTKVSMPKFKVEHGVFSVWLHEHAPTDEWDWFIDMTSADLVFYFKAPQIATLFKLRFG